MKHVVHPRKSRLLRMFATQPSLPLTSPTPPRVDTFHLCVLRWSNGRSQVLKHHRQRRPTSLHIPEAPILFRGREGGPL